MSGTRDRLLSMTASAVAILTVVAACGAPSRAPVGPVATADAGVDESDSGATEDETDGIAEAEDVSGAPEAEAEPEGPCPARMAFVPPSAVATNASPNGTTAAPGASGSSGFCIDKYEASLVEVGEDGAEKPFPHYRPVDGHAVRAVSEPGVMPQGFISEVQANDACVASGKRLCTHVEWKTACAGSSKTTFPYGDGRQPGVCHDTGKSAVGAVFGARALTDPVALPGPTKPAAGSAKPTIAAKPATPSKPTASKPDPKAAKPGAKPAQKPDGRRAHVPTKGRAAEATRTRPTRPSAPGSKPAPTKPASATASRAGAGQGKSRPATKRITGRASTKPASVEASVWTKLNDPALGQVEGALATTGSHPGCVNDFGVFDMVGNLHEWVATDPNAVHGTFAGGYYLDTSINGDGCNYRTVAHAHEYHDYSTGFRCCAPPH